MNNNMFDDEILIAIWNSYEETLKTRRDSDYVVNPKQMKRFCDLCQFFYDMAEDFEAIEIEPVTLRPIEEHGDITVRIPVFDIWGERIPKFCEALQYASVMSIEPTADDRVCLSIKVPYVFVRKDEFVERNRR